MRDSLCLSSRAGWRDWERLQGRVDDGAQCHSHARSWSLCATCPPVSLSLMTTFIMYSEGIIPLFLPLSLPPPVSSSHMHVHHHPSHHERGRMDEEGLGDRGGHTSDDKVLPPEIKNLLWCSFQMEDEIPFHYCVHPFFVISPPSHFSLLYFPAWSWPINCERAAGWTFITLWT